MKRFLTVLTVASLVSISASADEFFELEKYDEAPLVQDFTFESIQSTETTNSGDVDGAVSTVESGYSKLGSKLVAEGTNAVFGMPDALWMLVSNFPVHLEFGISLVGGAFQQGARNGNYLIRGPAYPEPKFELTLGLEFTRLVIAVYCDVGTSFNTKMDDTKALEGFGFAPGLVLNTGFKALYRVDRQGHLAGGLFAGYYQHLTNVRDERYHDLLGRGFLVGGIVRWKPVKLIAVNAKLGAGPEWMRTKSPEGETIKGVGVVVMASVGISFSWHNKYKEGSYPEALKTLAKGTAQKIKESKEAKQALEQAASQTAQHVEKEASGTVQHKEKTVEEESAAKSDSPSSTQLESASKPAPSDQQKDKPQSFQKAMLAAVNNERAKVGIPPLKWNYQLEAVAVIHAQDMVDHPPLFGHVGSDGSRVDKRANQQNYHFQNVGENVAQGHQSIEQVMVSWMNSPGHRVNILRPVFTEIGVARINDTWVQVFGSPMSEAVPNS